MKQELCSTGGYHLLVFYTFYFHWVDSWRTKLIPRLMLIKNSRRTDKNDDDLKGGMWPYCVNVRPLWTKIDPYFYSVFISDPPGYSDNQKILIVQHSQRLFYESLWVKTVTSGDGFWDLVIYDRFARLMIKWWTLAGILQAGTERALNEGRYRFPVNHIFPLRSGERNLGVNLSHHKLWLILFSSVYALNE